ncbi:hypothetical protein HKBW3S25_01541, partial [Candidatus Hakubella thermalkaliphila]
MQLWCEDEVHFQRHTSLIRMWAPRGQQPCIRSASTREKVSILGALDLKTGRLLTRQATTFNAQTFGHFLEYLLQHTDGKIHLILDNATWHRAKGLKDFFLTHGERLVRLFLPPLLSRTESDRAGLALLDVRWGGTSFSMKIP